MFYIDLFRELARHQVQYLLVGGLAVSLHGVERATMDVDILVAMDPNNMTALIEMAKALELQPVLPVALESLNNLALLKEWHETRNLTAFALSTREIAGVTLDILLFSPLDFSGMLDRAVTFKIADVDVHVASIDDLIALKRIANRAIDLSDIEHLEKVKSL